MSKILYLGTDPSRFGREVIHCPLIETKPLPLPPQVLNAWDQFTHLIVTSPNGAHILKAHDLNGKKILAIGKGTAQILGNCFAISHPETQEGMIALLQGLDLKDTYILYPRSSIARPLLGNYLLEAGIRHITCDLYETIFLKPDPLPHLTDFDEIVFTSPSTVKAFMAVFGAIPQHLKLTCIGPITEETLKKSIQLFEGSTNSFLLYAISLWFGSDLGASTLMHFSIT